MEEKLIVNDNNNTDNRISYIPQKNFKDEILYFSINQDEK